MKNLILFVCVTLMFSCNKEEIRPGSLSGDWELRHILGVQVANSPSDFEKGNGIIIRFSGNEYKQIEDGKVIAEGTFQIVKDLAEVDGNKYENKIIYDNNSLSYHIKLNDNQLLICTGSIAADGTTSRYEKIR